MRVRESKRSKRRCFIPITLEPEEKNCPHYCCLYRFWSREGLRISLPKAVFEYELFHLRAHKTMVKEAACSGGRDEDANTLSLTNCFEKEENCTRKEKERSRSERLYTLEPGEARLDP